MDKALPEALQRGHRLIAERQVLWNSSVQLALEPHDSIYNIYPYLFRSSFPSVDEDELATLSFASRLFSTAMVILDDVADAQLVRKNVAPGVRSSIAMQFEAYRELAALFPPESAFWPSFRKHLSDYAKGCFFEEEYGRRPDLTDFGVTRAVNIIKYKTAPTRAVLSGLGVLSGDVATAMRLQDALDSYNVARQLLDDLQDWREDLAARRATLVLARMFSAWPAAEPEIEIASRALYYDGHASDVLQLAIKHAESALDIIGATDPTLAVVTVVRTCRNTARQLYDDVEHILESARLRAVPSVSVDEILGGDAFTGRGAIGVATRFLLAEWRLGFGEARHLMRFPDELGFRTTRELQRGDVFQRTVVLETLLDVCERHAFAASPVITRELSYLIDAREREGIGAWPYFADVWELAPDADDLAQMIHVFTRTGNRDDVAAFCFPALECLLNDNRHPDGSFETFIVPAAQRTERQEAQARAAELAWGRGSDPDVVANLLSALVAFDPSEYAAVIEQGAGYLAACQHDGSWASTWYHGPYYGTYVACRFLDAVHHPGAWRARTCAFIGGSQNDDGGWSDRTGDVSNELQTALALLALSYADSAGAHGALERGVAFLEARAQVPEPFEATHYIRMDYGRTRGLPGRVMFYGSRTITAAFVARALARCEACFESALQAAS